MNNSNRLILSFATSALGSAVTWTGLPILVAQRTGDSSRIGDLFILLSLCTLVFAYGGGWSVDRFSARGASRTLNVLASLLVCVLFAICAAGKFQMIRPAILALFACTAMIDVVQGQWLVSLSDKMRLESVFAHRLTIIACAKVAGMTLGPLLFGALGEYALLFDAASFVLAALLQGAIADRNPSRAAAVKPSWKLQMPPMPYVLSSLLVGATGFPMTFVFLALLSHRMEKLAGAAGIFSAFWFIAGAFFIFSGFLVRWLLKRLGSPALCAMVLGVLIFASFLNIVLGRSYLFWMLAFGLIVLANPGLSVLVGAEFARSTSAAIRGRATAFLVIAEQISALGVLAIARNLKPDQLMMAACLLSACLVARAALVYRILKKGSVLG